MAQKPGARNEKPHRPDNNQVKRPHISVITAVHTKRSDHIRDTYFSLFDQQTSLRWEWVVQEDGPKPQLAAMLSHLNDQRIRYNANSKTLGPATTRNIALANAKAKHILILDGDDAYTPTAMKTLWKAIHEKENLLWAAGCSVETTKGKITATPGLGKIPAGTIPRGGLVRLQEKRTHHALRPIHCSGFMAKTSVVRALGGWMALPGGGEDKALLVSLSALGEGAFCNEILHFYRQWDKQMTKKKKYFQTKKMRRSIILQRAHALEKLPHQF